MLAEAAFQLALKHTFKAEGGWSDHPADRGGRTLWGITERTWRDWQRAHVIDREPRPLNEMQRSDAEAIYREWYWRANRCDGITHSTVAAEVFDTTVNCGMAAAGIMVQRACNLLTMDDGNSLKEDGVIGPRTLLELNALSSKYPQAVLAALNGEQYAYYREIVRRDPAQAVFIRGWAKRCLGMDSAA